MNGVDALIARVKAERLLANEYPPERRKAIREEAGVSLRDMGRAIGVSHAAIRKWELGEHNPRSSEDYFKLLVAIEAVLAE